MYALRRCFKSTPPRCLWPHIAAWQQATDAPLADLSAPVQAAFIDVVLLAVRGIRGVVTFDMEHRMSIIALRRLEIRGGLLGIALLLGLPVATDAAESVPV